MRSRFFGKKIKSSAILSIVFVLILSFVLSSATSIHSAHAAGSQGSRETAQKKQLYQILYHCVANGAAPWYYSRSNLIKEHRIIQDDSTSWTHGSSYVERQLYGEYGDGAVSCEGRQFGKWETLQQVLSGLGLDYMNDFICNYKTTNAGGIVNVDSSTSCAAAVDTGSGLGGYKNGNEKMAYINDVVTNKTFGGDVPGGSLDTFTDLEKYYIYQDAFLNVCGYGSADFSGTEYDYKIYAWDPSSGELKLGGYARSRDKGHNVKLYQSYGNSDEKLVKTCQEIAEVLSTNSDEVKAYANELASGVDCNKKVADAVESIRSWASSHDGEYSTTAEAEISTLLAKYGSVSESAKVTFGSDGVVSFNCPSLDSLSHEWEDIKSRNSLGGDTPSISTDPGVAGSTGTGTGVEASCHNSAGSLGWILCPVLELAANASQYIYESFIEPSLVISHNLFNADASISGTRNAWGRFRDLANIVFAILLLFVIFSQVTGFGIDNYGIKKTLPKLIVAAILVNLSFYVCQLAVDASNIVGTSLKAMFEEIGNGITVPAAFLENNGISDGVYVGGSIALTVLGAVGGVALWSTFAGGLGATAAAIGGFLLAILPAVLGALVGVIFLFVLLALRQALTVILVVLSPLAFVCYTLPNTKKLFDRWLQLLKGMLILYPICSLLVYGGRLVARILLSTGGTSTNLWLLIAAMAAEIAPIFFIPGLVRNAYRATGTLGARLNSLRGRLTGDARNRVTNNRAYKSAQRQAEFRRNQRLANRYESANAKSTGGRNRLVRGVNRLYAGSRANQERVMESRKAEVAEEQRRQDLAKWAGTNTTDFTGREYRDQNGNLITQGQATVNAQIQQATLGAEAETARANLLNNGAYISTRRGQNAKVISDEVTKTFEDQYSRMATPEIQAQITNAASAAPGTQNQLEQIIAGIRTLASMGQGDKARESIDENSVALHTIANTADADGGFTNRTRLAQAYAGAGTFETTEYAKHLGKFGADADHPALDFHTWATSAEVERDGDGVVQKTLDGDDKLVEDRSLAASIQKKGLGNLDKDSLEYASTTGALERGASAREIARATSQPLSNEMVAKFANAIRNFSDASKRDKIRQVTTASQFVNMNENVRVQIATAADWKNQLGEELKKNPQIAARLNAVEHAKYVNS